MHVSLAINPVFMKAILSKVLWSSSWRKIQKIALVMTFVWSQSFLLHAQTQPFEVTGTVTSSDNSETLPGVNILIKGTTTGAVTDLNGNFSITVPSPNAVLQISSIGYAPQEIQVGNRTVINMVLE